MIITYRMRVICERRMKIKQFDKNDYEAIAVRALRLLQLDDALEPPLR
jgi:hypothetical protein